MLQALVGGSPVRFRHQEMRHSPILNKHTSFFVVSTVIYSLLRCVENMRLGPDYFLYRAGDWLQDLPVYHN